MEFVSDRFFSPVSLLSPWPFTNGQNHLLTILQAKLPSTLGCQGPKVAAITGLVVFFS